MQLFKLIPNEGLAVELLEAIGGRLETKGIQNYSEIYRTLGKDEVLLAYLPDVLEKIGSPQSLDPYPVINEDDAILMGFYLGVRIGKLPILANKITELDFFYRTILESYGKTNSMFVKAYFFSFASTIYSIKEVVKNYCCRLDLKAKNIELTNWWNKKNDEIHTKGELLDHFRHWFSNKYKHEGTVMLKSIALYRFNSFDIEARLNQYMENPHFVLGPDGVCRKKTFGEGNILEIDPTFYVAGLQTIEYLIEFVHLPKFHLGQEIESKEFLNIISLLYDYYYQLVLDFFSRIDK